MTQIGFSLQAQYDQPTEQVISLLKDAGFFAVSPVWSPELDLDFLSACVQSSGMTIQSIHAPLESLPLLWDPHIPLSEKVAENMLRCIDDCARRIAKLYEDLF